MVRSRVGRHPPGRAGRLASLFDPPPATLHRPTATARPDSAAPPDRPGRTGSMRRMVRVAAWTLPAYALVHLWLGLRSSPEPGDDPLGWAGQVTTGDYLRTELLAGLGGGLLGLVAVVALTGLLAGGRSHLLAGAGLLAGLAAATLLLPRLGVVIFAAPAAGEAVLGGEPGAAELYRQAYEDGAGAVVAGVVLLSVAWLLLGVAVWRSGVLSRADGLLLMLAAPLLGVAGLVERLLVPLGALLLLAGGIGIAWSGAGRSAQPAGAPPGAPQSAHGAGD